MDVRLVHPFTMIVAGPTQSGKTWFVKKLIENRQLLVNKPPERIIYCYAIYQDSYPNMSGVEFHQGLDVLKEIDGKTRTLIILDDLMAETDSRVTKLFTKGSHHYDASVIYIVQNIFNQAKEHRTISLNSHYLLLFKNPREKSQITNLAKQIYPHNTKFLLEAYNEATKAPHTYILLDLTQQCPEPIRVRTGIFPGDLLQVYVPKNI